MSLKLPLVSQLPTRDVIPWGPYSIIDLDEPSAMDRFLEWLLPLKGHPIPITLDFETVAPKEAPIQSPKHQWQAEPVIAALAHPQSEALVLVHHPRWDAARSDQEWHPFLDKLATLPALAMYNASYDLMFLHRIAGRIPSSVVDVMVLYGLVTAGHDVRMINPSLSLQAAVSTILDHDMSKEVRESFYADRFDFVTTAQCRYAAEDAYLTSVLLLRLLRECNDLNMSHLVELECQLTPILFHMSQLGVEVDREELQSISERMTQLLQAAYDQMLDTLSEDRWFVVDDRRRLTLADCVRQLRAGNGSALVAPTFFNGLPLSARQRIGKQVEISIESYLALNGSRFWRDYTRIKTRDHIHSAESSALESLVDALRATENGFTLSCPEENEVTARALQARVRHMALHKIYSTYVRAWLALTQESEDGRIHTRFLQTQAESGRLSSRNPNMQNCPRPDTTEHLLEGGLDLRRIVRAPAGMLLITADYSQYELRVAAQRANETKMIETYQKDAEIRQAMELYLLKRYGLHPWDKEAHEIEDERLEEFQLELQQYDLHRLNASRIFGKDPHDVTKVERTQAKAIIFGVLYGMQESSLARHLTQLTGQNISRDEAAQMLRAFFSSYPNLEQYIKRTIFHARDRGWVASIAGRRRWTQFPSDTTGKGFMYDHLRSRAAATEREAVNHTIQATNADAIKYSIVELHRLLRAHDLCWERPASHQAYPILTVHDELVVQTPRDQASFVAALVRQAMIAGSQKAGLTIVPTVVEVVIDDKWSK